MKKAKLLLSFIIGIAALSGTLALKVHLKGTPRKYYVCPLQGTQTCSTATTLVECTLTLTTIQPGNFIQFTTNATLTDPQGAQPVQPA